MSEPHDAERDTAAGRHVPDDVVEQARALTTAGVVAELIGDVRDLSGAVTELDGAYRAEQALQAERLGRIEKARRRDLALVGITLLTGLAAVGLMVAVGVGVGRLNDLARTNERNSGILVDCTIPAAQLPDAQRAAIEDLANRCYERGQAATNRAVFAIVRCGRIPADAPTTEVEECLAHELAPAAGP